jgi:predicted DNA-binding antitoxin AbrB/MazE fold protein
MSHTIAAIYENGVFRPLEKVDLDNGEEVEVILLDRAEPNSPQRSRDILAEIAALPMESNTNGFSGKDHDDILYPKQ